MSFRFVIPDEQLQKVLADKSGEEVPDKWTKNDVVAKIQSK